MTAQKEASASFSFFGAFMFVGPYKPHGIYFYVRSDVQTSELLMARAHDFPCRVVLTEEDNVYTCVNIWDIERIGPYGLQRMYQLLIETYLDAFWWAELPHPDYAKRVNAETIHAGG